MELSLTWGGTMGLADVRQDIIAGRSALGIELGSTRIKAALITPAGEVLATGVHDWENQFQNRIWTYSLPAVWEGIQDCYKKLSAEVNQRYGTPLSTIGAIGVSAMMHGYLVFDSDHELLVPFRTWRNTMTEVAAAKLSECFQYSIPQRWSVAHLYQAVLNDEPHVSQIAFMTTLAGYVHWMLSGEKVLGVGDASGMFPVDTATKGFSERLLAQFDSLIADRGLGWQLADILPKVLSAGEPAGVLSAAGARLLDPSGVLQPGIALCPPEGDAGTGMVATNAVARRTGNVSAGTSIFAMVVLERELSALHTEIDLVTTPVGDLVAMVHCNNGASELDAWAGVFAQFATALGTDADNAKVFETLFRQALVGESDAGGLLAYNYLAGETITGLAEGRPLYLRTPDSHLSLANFMRAQILGMFATLALGMRILHDEGVGLDSMFAHGGIFKTAGVAQRLLAAALNTPVTLSTTASEGGSWGMAVLAAYLAPAAAGQSLTDYLNQVIFATAETTTVAPVADDVAGFATYLSRYETALPVLKTAIKV
ncbi:MAG: ATPase, partial [Propionibacteriaceae bacterium]|nr:ATPase [Propionibacteriaceae bacterium]